MENPDAVSVNNTESASDSSIEKNIISNYYNDIISGNGSFARRAASFDPEEASRQAPYVPSPSITRTPIMPMASLTSFGGTVSAPSATSAVSRDQSSVSVPETAESVTDESAGIRIPEPTVLEKQPDDLGLSTLEALVTPSAADEKAAITGPSNDELISSITSSIDELLSQMDLIASRKSTVSSRPSEEKKLEEAPVEETQAEEITVEESPAVETPAEEAFVEETSEVPEAAEISQDSSAVVVPADYEEIAQNEEPVAEDLTSSDEILFDTEQTVSAETPANNEQTASAGAPKVIEQTAAAESAEVIERTEPEYQPVPENAVLYEEIPSFEIQPEENLQTESEENAAETDEANYCELPSPDIESSEVSAGSSVADEMPDDGFTVIEIPNIDMIHEETAQVSPAADIISAQPSEAQTDDTFAVHPAEAETLNTETVPAVESSLTNDGYIPVNTVEFDFTDISFLTDTPVVYDAEKETAGTENDDVIPAEEESSLPETALQTVTEAENVSAADGEPEEENTAEPADDKNTEITGDDIVLPSLDAEPAPIETTPADFVPSIFGFDSTEEDYTDLVFTDENGSEFKDILAELESASENEPEQTAPFSFDISEISFDETEAEPAESLHDESDSTELNFEPEPVSSSGAEPEAVPESLLFEETDTAPSDQNIIPSEIIGSDSEDILFYASETGNEPAAEEVSDTSLPPFEAENEAFAGTLPEIPEESSEKTSENVPVFIIETEPASEFEEPVFDIENAGDILNPSGDVPEQYPDSSSDADSDLTDLFTEPVTFIEPETEDSDIFAEQLSLIEPELPAEEVSVPETIILPFSEPEQNTEERPLREADKITGFEAIDAKDQAPVEQEAVTVPAADTESEEPAVPEKISGILPESETSGSIEPELPSFPKVSQETGTFVVPFDGTMEFNTVEPVHHSETTLFDISDQLQAATLAKDYTRSYTPNNVSAEAKETLLSVKNADSIYYISRSSGEPYRVCEKLSFELKAGSICGLVSDVRLSAYVTAREIAERCEKQTDSSVSIHGAGDKSGMLYIGSDSSLPGDITLKSYLVSVCSGDDYKTVSQRVGLIISQLGLGNLENTPLYDLSVCKKILVLITAAALNDSVKCVIVNDPAFKVTMEDDMLARRVCELLNSNGKCALLSCCSDLMLSSVCNKLLVMKEGREVYFGSFVNFVDSKCLDLLNCKAADSEAVIDMLESGYPNITCRIDGDMLHLSLKPDEGSVDLEQLINDLNNSGAETSTIKVNNKSFVSAIKEVYSE